jgi:hypothetical protein
VDIQAAVRAALAEDRAALAARQALAADLAPFLEAQKTRTDEERAALAAVLGQGE